MNSATSLENPFPPYCTVIESIQELTPIDFGSDYESEAQLEQRFISLLTSQGYQYFAPKSPQELQANLRTQLQRLNGYTFSDGEWQDFLLQYLGNRKESIAQKAYRIQRDAAIPWKSPSGDTFNIRLIEKEALWRNHLQVMHQYTPSEGTYPNRYDVTLLVNGLPLVHIELKSRGKPLREAFDQIDRYRDDSFWADGGLFEFVQLFVISNGTETKYYSNTTRQSLVEAHRPGNPSGKKVSHKSFRFTTYWTDQKNRRISDLYLFAQSFLAPSTLLNILTKYCILDTEGQLLVMRPYQIAATEAILHRITQLSEGPATSPQGGSGYIWHTTGSGKTLTSFKVAQLATSLPEITKVLFVVDRQDLDYQTLRAYESYEAGSANGTTNAKALERLLADDPAKLTKKELNATSLKLVVTTIQKLNIFVKNHATHPLYSKNVVLIFDECHRSQFGAMHQAIRSHFHNAYIFGFTGTPIFARNSDPTANPRFATTEDLFGDQLHRYTVIDAIREGTVLRFHVEYARSFRAKSEIAPQEVRGIDESAAYEDPRRIESVASYILSHFDRLTLRNKFAVKREGKIVRGFNSIFAVSSTSMAQCYYKAFRELQKDLPPEKRLRIATIYSYAVNENRTPEDEAGIILDEDNESTSQLDQPSRDFLDEAMADYNALFGTSFSTLGKGFHDYYKDISERMRHCEVDLLIVVNMFLTGFDAPRLNTLWVDKNLKYHGLMQAFSRTNRIYNEVKAYGNIVCFRNIQDQVEKSLALYAGETSTGQVLLRSFQEYLKGYTDEKGNWQEGYARIVQALQEEFPLDPQHSLVIAEEESKRRLLSLFGVFLRAENILRCFDEFTEENLLKEGVSPLSEREKQDYRSLYLTLRDEWRKAHQTEKADIREDLVFETEFIIQDDITIDWILHKAAEYSDSKDKRIVAELRKFASGSPAFYQKKELIDRFIKRITPALDAADLHSVAIPEIWHEQVSEYIQEGWEEVLKEYHLQNNEKTIRYLEKVINGVNPDNLASELADILPQSIGIFDPDRAQKKASIAHGIDHFVQRADGLLTPSEFISVLKNRETLQG